MRNVACTTSNPNFRLFSATSRTSASATKLALSVQYSVMPTSEDIMERLRYCYDPEIPLNIVDLGLIYKVDVNEGDVEVEMTLTAQGCPSHTEISRDVKMTILNMPGVNTVKVDVVWDPPWNPSRISEEGRQKLGIDA
jgi:metal-sulfur cluster biosynthetic enzyme